MKSNWTTRAARPLAVAVAALFVAGAAVAAGTVPAAAAARPEAAELDLGTRLGRALAVPHVNQSRTAAVVVDLATGRLVFARNRGLSLAPASTEKLTLAYALLATLGPTHRIETSVLGDGFLDGDTWRGNLVLKGSGDPALTTAQLRRLAAQVRGYGIRRVTGAVVGDETLFDTRRTAPGWKSSYYLRESPPLSALSVDRGRYRGAVTRNPALAAATIFRSALAERGVAVAGPARVGRASAAAQQIGLVRSEALVAMLRLVNRESDNFTAEILLKYLGALYARRGTTAAGSAVVRNALAAAGVPLRGVRIADGSGLSLLNRLTTDTLVALLAAAWSDPVLRGSFQASLAVAGRSGTLRHRLRAAAVRGRVLAKTGTTSLASTLAGYVGGRYAFAILHNGPPLSSWWSRRAQDRFVTVLASP